ncbi:hypothetical protein E4U55_007360 [Claviceps digitariae]|nr:hypothetical protein E4U55_007360 [Claviceps digitariae]
MIHDDENVNNGRQRDSMPIPPSPFMTGSHPADSSFGRALAASKKVISEETE